MHEKVLDHLKRNPGPVSGEEISRHFHVSRAGIWKHIEEFRRLGYEIAAVPHLGYRLVSCPDKLLPWEVQFHLGTRIFGSKVIFHEKCASTMDEAFRLGLEGAPEGTVVCAESQSHGRGRLGRSWISPRGHGVYLSVILRPHLGPAQLPQLTLLCAVAVCEALRQASGLDVRIKWPNDLLAKGRKLAGILMELKAEIDEVKFIVMGLGINVNTPAGQLPDGATSLKNETGKTFSRVALVQDILRSFEIWYEEVRGGDFAKVIHRWKALSQTLGHPVSVSGMEGAVRGLAVDLDSDGALLIRTASGKTVRKVSGDVTVLKR